jgi:hypothetical protein
VTTATMAELQHGKVTTYNKHGCRCAKCRAAASAYARNGKWNRAEKRDENRVSTWVQQHGRNAYGNSMCRCKVCTDANRLYERKIRAARFAKRVLVDGRLTAAHVKEHGLTATYGNWGCRCEPCTRANAEANRSRRPPKGRLPPAWVAALEAARTNPGQWHPIVVCPSADAASSFAYRCRTGTTKAVGDPANWEFRVKGREVHAQYEAIR